MRAPPDLRALTLFCIAKGTECFIVPWNACATFCLWKRKSAETNVFLAVEVQ